MKQLVITQDNANQRLDKYLLKYFNTASKSFIYKMLRKKRIKYNGGKADGNEILNDGDTLQMYLSDETVDKFMEEKEIKSDKVTFKVVFEDNNILIVNKPIGVLSHPESSSDTNTLIDQILFYLNEKGEFDGGKESVFTPSICNRLDRNTSGIIICGKNLATVQCINRCMSTIDKYYLSIVKGKIDSKIILNGFHTKDKNKNEVNISSENLCDAKKVVTEVNPLQYNEKFSLVEIKLETGKSHQIRAHLKSINHPIIGDRKYGDTTVNDFVKSKYALSNQFLTAHRIHFRSMDKPLDYLNDKIFTADMPKIFMDIRKNLF